MQPQEGGELESGKPQGASDSLRPQPALALFHPCSGLSEILSPYGFWKGDFFIWKD